MASPVVVLSFNRPRYLAAVLESLAVQTALPGREVLLFQDNAVNPHSGLRHAEDADIAACVALFRRAFPRGGVFTADRNIGVAANYARAETFVFTEMGCDAAYFFEDDMILSPHYLTMMDSLCGFAAGNERIGYFAAYGNHLATAAQQRAKSGVIRPLGYLWGFGLMRRHWLDLRKWLEPYYAFLSGHDYRERPKRAIGAHYRAQGHPLAWTSQDHLKKVGTYALGRVAINTFACFGRNIGEHGLTMTPAIYGEGRFAEAEFHPDPVTLHFPSPAEIENLHAAEVARQWRRLERRAAGGAG